MMEIIQPRDGEPVGSAFAVSSEDRSREMLARYEASSSFTAAWRERCRQWWRSYEGKPLPEADTEYMQESGRPVVSYNISLGTLNAVLGADMAELKEPKFSGIDTDLMDHVVAEWMTTIVRHCRIRTHGHDAEAAMFLEQLVTGLGGLRGSMDNSRFPFRIKEKAVQSSAIYWDPSATEVNFRDRNWHILRHRWSLADAVAHWPKKESVLRAFARDASTGGTEEYASGNATNYGPGASTGGSTLYESMASGSAGEATHSVEIYEYEYVSRRPWVAYTDPVTGEDVQMSEKEFKAPGGPLQAIEGRLEMERIIPGVTHKTIAPDDATLALDEYGNPVPILDEEGFPVPVPGMEEVDYVTFPKRSFRRAYFAVNGRHAAQLDDQELPYDRFSVVLCTGFLSRDERGRMVPFGLMSVIDDPQKYAVKILSSILEMLKRSSKGNVFIKPGALLSPGTFADDVANPTRAVFLSDEANVNDDIYQGPALQWPAALERFFDIVLEAVPEVSGVTRAFKGTLTQERSNVLIQTLNTQSTVMLQPVYRPLNEARRETAFLLAELVVRYLSDDYINKILGDQEVAGITHEAGPDGRVRQDEFGNAIPILKDDGTPITPADILRNAELLDFDVEVDVGSASPTARRDFWRIFVDTNLLGQLTSIPGFPIQDILPVLFKYMPLPAEEAARLSAKMEDLMTSNPMQRAMEMIQEMPPEAVQELYEALGGVVEGGGPGPMRGGGGGPVMGGAGQAPGMMGGM